MNLKKHLRMKFINNMERTYLIKSEMNFAITSNSVNPDIITKKLGLIPDRFFRKGEKYISKHSGTQLRPHNIWEIRSVPTSIDSEDLSPHFKYFKSILEDKKEILIEMKQDTSLELIFSLSIETDYADYAFDLLEEDISFINTIANRVSFWIKIKGYL